MSSISLDFFSFVSAVHPLLLFLLGVVQEVFLSWRVVLEGDCSPTNREAGTGQRTQFIISTMDVKLFSCVKFHTLTVN